MNSRISWSVAIRCPTTCLRRSNSKQVVGEYVVGLNDQLLASIPLITDGSVQRAGLVKVLVHGFRLLERKQKKLVIWAAVVVMVLIAARLYVAYLRRKRRRRQPRFRLARD